MKRHEPIRYQNARAWERPHVWLMGPLPLPPPIVRRCALMRRVGSHAFKTLRRQEASRVLRKKRRSRGRRYRSARCHGLAVTSSGQHVSMFPSLLKPSIPRRPLEHVPSAQAVEKDTKIGTEAQARFPRPEACGEIAPSLRLPVTVTDRTAVGFDSSTPPETPQPPKNTRRLTCSLGSHQQLLGSPCRHHPLPPPPRRHRRRQSVPAPRPRLLGRDEPRLGGRAGRAVDRRLGSQRNDTLDQTIV